MIVFVLVFVMCVSYWWWVWFGRLGLFGWLVGRCLISMGIGVVMIVEVEGWIVCVCLDV